MNLISGNLYSNRTLSYLVPPLAIYGSLFTSKINLLQKFAFGVFDNLLESTYLQDQLNIYCLVSTSHRPNETENTLNWFKNQEYYVTDYAVGKTSRMLVISFPEKMADAYRNFLESKYSLMYTKEEIEKYFGTSAQNDISQVLRKTTSATITHIQRVNMEYNTSITLGDIIKSGESYEVDFPWKKEEEIFNF